MSWLHDCQKALIEKTNNSIALYKQPKTTASCVFSVRYNWQLECCYEGLHNRLGSESIAKMSAAFMFAKRKID